MRTTVEIADDTYFALEAKAASEGSSVKALIHRALDELLQSSPRLQKNISSAFPILRSKRPSSQKIDNEIIFGGIEFP